MRVDFKIAIILALAALPAGAALMVAPEYLHLSGIAVPLTFWSGIALTVVLIVIAIIIALRAELESPRSVGRWGLKRMWPQYLMVFAGCLFFIGLVAFLQKNVEKPNGDNVHEIPKQAGPKPSASILPPSLLTLFMTDFKRRDGIIWDAVADVDLMKEGKKTGSYRLFYKILNDFVANSKFMAIFVPEATEGSDVMSFLAENYQGYFTDIEKQHWAVAGSPGMSDAINTKDLPFSGRLYVYHEAPYSLERLAAYAKLFREHGATVQFRGPEYVVAVWQSMRAGDVKPFPVYTIVDGIPKETSPAH